MMVLMMMTMMIPVMPGTMTVTVVTISPSGSPRQEGVFSLFRFNREEAAENFYEVAPR